MWKEVFLESPSIYFLETAALGNAKWIERKESVFLTGKTKCIPGTNRDCGRISPCHFSGKVLWKGIVFLFSIFARDLNCAKLSSVWTLVGQGGKVFSKLILINIGGSMSCTVSL